MVGSVVRHHVLLVGSALGAVTATGSDDTRTVMAIVVLLAVVGIGLAMLAMWVFRVTRPDRELLAPLEVMGDRAWRRGDPVWQRRRLDEVRPADAAPFRPTSAPPAIDESYDAGPTAPGFADLHDPHDAADGAVDVDVDADGAERVDGGAPAAATSEELDAADETIATEVPADVPTDGERATDPSSEPEVGLASESVGEPGADVDRSPEADEETEVDEVDEADGAEDAVAPVDGKAVGETSSPSDDVSSTPRDGIARSEFVAASPSADPDATLADLVAAAEEPAPGDDGSDDPVRSGE